ncbi:MAG TPA: hypothetical protein PLZ77_01480 [Lachnospiraceae bacterium]|nr:hypothetical protein [Lachnospiraceae bacterium]
MKTNIMAICDTDEQYLYRLQEMLCLRGAFPFTISVYRSAKQLLEDGGVAHHEIVLASAAIYQELASGKDLGLLVLLKEQGDDIEADNVIFKYQSVECIRREILKIYDSRKEEVTSDQGERRETKLIGVYSPVGRCVQTSFSFLVGQFLSKENNVLYLNFEPFSGLSRLVEGQMDKDLTDLVYYLRGGAQRLRFKLESMVVNINGLDFVSPAFSFVDLSAISEENWMLLIRTLREMGSYDYIILDLSEMIQGLLNVLRECNYIYTIANHDGMAAAKMEQYEELLNRLEYKDVRERTTQCEIPVFKKLPSSLADLPYSELAGYVRKIIQKEMAG